jgi:hypothetical protein
VRSSVRLEPRDKYRELLEGWRKKTKPREARAKLVERKTEAPPGNPTTTTTTTPELHDHKK